MYIVIQNDAQKLRSNLVLKQLNANISIFPATEEENKTFSNPQSHPWFVSVKKGEKDVLVEWSEEIGFNVKCFFADKNHLKPVIAYVDKSVDGTLSIIMDFLENFNPPS